MTTGDHIVIIVDDDERIREALKNSWRRTACRPIAFASAGAYVRAEKPDVAILTLILDVELPDINGLELQKQIAQRATTRRSSSSRATATFASSVQRHQVAAPSTS